MTTEITSSSPNIVVTNNSFIFVNNTNLNTAGRYTGEVIYANGDLYTWDQGSWIAIRTQHDVSLGYNAEMALDWAVKKMQEEKSLDEMCEKFPALAKARSQFEMLKALVEHDLEKE